MSDFDLRSVPLLATLPDHDLERLSESLGTCEVPRGDVLFSEGDEGDWAYIITGGEIEILKESAERQVRIAVLGEGGILGEMALLTGEMRNATAKALTDATLVSIPKDSFDTVISESAPAARALFDVFLQRWREQEDRLRQSERMAQIGVLTAGLAHEMNNPAAAVTRGAEQLTPSIKRYVEAVRSLPPDCEVPVDLSQRERPVLSGMDRSDREDELEDALTDQGIEEPWLYTSPLTDAGLVASELDGIPAEHAAEIISVLAAEADVYGLVAEVDEGSKRLSELVGALKSYSFLDQAPVQEVNVVKGIDDTLLILKSKTKSIAIDREYAPDLPLITAYGSQLNQVWTNLIDNASDSLRDAETPDPKITIKAFEREGCIIVTINDNGPGIPPAVRERIFEAFYTTKEPGKGTGLGLDTVYSIVVKQHRGAVEVESEPGSTTFEVKIPLDLETAVV